MPTHCGFKASVLERTRFQLHFAPHTSTSSTSLAGEQASIYSFIRATSTVNTLTFRSTSRSMLFCKEPAITVCPY